jgi:hypothetical protein
MRVFRTCAAAGLLTATWLATGYGQANDADKVLAAARAALGGEKRLSAVKSFTATGRTRRIQGDNLVPIEFEVFCELPDKYLRKDEIPAQESGPTSSGFNGDALVQIPPFTPPTRPGAPPPTEAQVNAMLATRVTGVKQDFARLTLGMFATSFSSYPLTFTLAGQAEAPQGKADVLDVKGPAGFALRLFVSSDTHLPIMVSWQPPARPMPMRGGPGGDAMGPGRGMPPAGAGPGREGAVPPARGAGPPPAPAAPAAPAPGAPPAPAPGATSPAGPAPAATAKPPEFRIYYSDYRDVDGMQWPFRIRRGVGTDTTEETTFDRFKINPKIDPKKFEVVK